MDIKELKELEADYCPICKHDTLFHYSRIDRKYCYGCGNNFSLKTEEKWAIDNGTSIDWVR